MTMKCAYGIGVVALGAIAAVMGDQWVAIAAAQEKPATPTIKEKPYTAITSAEGKDTFAAYCTACHGKDARGNGPAASALARPVPDLTQLAARNNGKFDAVAVRNVIYGRDRMPAAHGTQTMPIWGPLFENEGTARDVAALRLTNLVNYLQSLQQKSS